jgi:hypothetical protein
MAIDSASKRASVLGVGLAFTLLVIPDSAVTQPDRQTIAHCYSGITASAPVIDTPDCVLPLTSDIDATPTVLSSAINATAIAVNAPISAITALQSVITNKDTNLTSAINIENNFESNIQSTFGIDAELCDC